MRALAILFVLCRVAVADPRTAPIGFDHMVHDRTIAVNDQPALACTRCHAGRGGLARPDHASCFGAGCHAAPVKGATVPPDDQRVCTSCHAESALAKPAGKLAVAYPPYLIDPDFAVTIGHAKHAAIASPDPVGARSGAERRGDVIACAQCHASPGVKKPAAPHARCTACHDGARGPAMTACETCHIRATGAPEPTRLAQSTLPVTFSHAAHAGRSAAGRACATCHAGVAATNDHDLPRPTAKTCAIAGCHVDPVRAPGGVFGIATAACSRCHTTAPVRTFHIERPTERFSHAKHAVVTQNRPCAACHALAPATGQPVAAPHEACMTAACHADEAGNPRPTICGACHNTTEPWRALAVDRAPAETSEFGASLDHGKHPAACTSCHVLRTATRELRTPRGHASCTGAGCHAISSGPAPQLLACEGCHVTGLEATRTRDRTTAPWSVRGVFRHTRPHTTRADEKPVPCESCHADLTAVTVLSLAAPAKATCAPCHDGKAAFKLTGTGCNRCHRAAGVTGSAP